MDRHGRNLLLWANVFTLGFLCLSASQVASSSLGFAPDVSDCGTSLGCFRAPSGCSGVSGCASFLVWNASGPDAVDFFISTRIDHGNVGGSDTFWTAVAFNTEPQMPGGKVVDCIHAAQPESFIVQSSYNPQHFNQVLQDSQLGLVPGSTAGRFSGGLLQCVFSHYKHVNASNAEADRVPALGPGDVYYLELGTGPASATGVKQQHVLIPFISTSNVSMEMHVNMGGEASSQALFKIHGILMILAWVLSATVGQLVARYCRGAVLSRKVCGAAAWFRVHQTFMVLTLLLTSGGFVVIFLQMRTDFPARSVHPVLGVIVMALVLLNPVVAVMRPPADHSGRSLFYYTHTGIALLTQLTAGAALSLGVRYSEVDLPAWAFWFTLAWVVCRLLVDVVLTALRLLGKRWSEGTYMNLQDNKQDQNQNLNFNRNAQNSTGSNSWVPVMEWIVARLFIPISTGVAAVLITELGIAMSRG